MDVRHPFCSIYQYMMKAHSACFILLLTASQSFLSPVLYAQHLFTITDLGTLGGTSSSASGVSDYGQVVGTSTTAYGASRAFTWWNGAMYDLGTLGGDFSSANAINNHGQVVGVATTATGDQHAFLFQGTTMTDLGTLGGSSSAANALNDYAQIVGSSTLANGQTRAFVWVDGAMTDLGALGVGAASSTASGINNAGEIIGKSELGPSASYPSNFPFTFSGSQMSSVNDLLHGSADSQFSLTGINNSGQIVGGGKSTNLLASTNAFILSAGGATFFSLPPQPSSGFFIIEAEATAINDAGLVVGSTYSSTYRNASGNKAMVYYQGVTAELNTLVDLSGTNFTNLDYATGVNNADQIVGTGTMKDGSSHAFLLTPIPAPSLP